jgi:PIN domain nuclease of toxin-antitoxin system
MRTDRLLLDTHVFLWWRVDSPALGAEARSAIATADLVMVSAASAWEAAVKASLGKLRLAGSFEAGVEDSGFAKLPIELRHAEAVAKLPLLHHDPFDRMLIAQAQLERLTLVSHDQAFAGYDVAVLRT